MVLKKLIASLSVALIASPVFASSMHFIDGLVPSGKGYGIPSSKAPPALATKLDNGIEYHGGEVMGTATTGIPNAYVIYYGNWPTNSGQSLIENFLKNIGSSSWYNIHTTYYNASNQDIQRQFNFAGTYNDNYSQGKSLTDNSVVSIVANAITSGKFPLDSKGMYFVLTSPDVLETSGFCSSYCGWHVPGVYENKAYIRVAFIGNASTQCPAGCMAQSSVSPNSNPGIDGMISIMAHELSESVTDPLTNAWYDVNGQEDSDKCNFNFGNTQALPNGAKYNITLNCTNYLIQQLWVNAKGGYCSQTY